MKAYVQAGTSRVQRKIKLLFHNSFWQKVSTKYYVYLPLYYHVDIFILQARRPLRRVFWLTCK